MKKHRSPKAVQIWLMTRTWFKKYKKYLFNEYDYDRANFFLYGLYGESTISSAFAWGETEEGVSYWAKKEEKFLRWYYYQGKEIFRCKWFTIQIKF